jgi:translation initiation factor 5A
MSIRKTEIQKLKVGSYLIEEGEPCLIKSIEKSKSGKHGHAKLRVVCVGLFDGNKRSLTIPSGHMVETPEILKGSGQINFIENESLQIMDLESYESFDIPWPEEPDLIAKLKELQQDATKMSASTIEYWDLLGKKLIKRIVTN